MSVTGAEVVALYEQHGGLLKGHFALTSGLHSSEYWQSARVMAHPSAAELLGAALAEACRPLDATLVVGPAMGGLIIAHEVARALGAPMMFTERQDGAMILRRGFAVGSGDRVLIVEDVITTGGSVKEVLAVMRHQGAAVVGVGCIVDRSSAQANFDVPLCALTEATPVTYEPADCPLCRQGTPAVKPGSRPEPS